MVPTTVGVVLEETGVEAADIKSPETVGKFKIPAGTEVPGLGRAGETLESADEITYLPGAVPTEASEESVGDAKDVAMSMPVMAQESIWDLEDDDQGNYDMTYTAEKFQELAQREANLTLPIIVEECAGTTGMVLFTRAQWEARRKKSPWERRWKRPYKGKTHPIRQ